LIFGLIVSRDKYIIENNLQGANIEFTKLLKDKANEFGIIIISTELIVN
jgi:hypothetical protein